MIRFHWRPLIPGETDPERLWGILLGATGVLVASWLWLGLPTPACPLHAITGIPCPTCGATRGVRCLIHGDWGDALRWNPLLMMGLLGTLLYTLYAGVVVVGRLPRVRWEPLSPRSIRAVRMAVIGLIAGDWLYLVLRERLLP